MPTDTGHGLGNGGGPTCSPVRRATTPHRILLVEDHLDLCGTAASAEQALDALAKTAFDIPLTDVGLTGLDGGAFTS